MATCYLGIGSNLGPRRKNIKSAIERLDALKSTKVIKASRLMESAPVGGPPGQGKFLNGALKIKTSLSPRMLLKALKGIESELGRKKGVRNGPRVIDLDILFYAERVIKARGLEIPHPKLFERDFVLKPLAEVV